MGWMKYFDFGDDFTFSPDKKKALYNWFYYKEAFSSFFVERIIKELDLKPPFLDPFCGAGTTLLYCKLKNLESVGVDCNPLSVMISRVKTRNYDIDVLKSTFEQIFKTESIESNKEWGFKFFKPETVFPRKSLSDFFSLKEKINEIETQREREFFLVALTSVIPQTSFILKDGGVLKIDKKKRLMPVRIAFKRKALRMISEASMLKGIEPEVLNGDARDFECFNGLKFSSIITSPPYLNGVDYSKIYGLELNVVGGWSANFLRSFLLSKSMNVMKDAYFEDMEKVLRVFDDCLIDEGIAAMVVGNSVVGGEMIKVDEILAEMGSAIGFKSEIIVGKERGVRHLGFPSVRESVVIFRK
jgi:hypothetical protein